MTIKLPPGTPVLNMDAPDFADQLREAVGAKPGDVMQVRGPQFDRSATEPAPGCPPIDWSALRSMDKLALKEMGCGVWDEPDASGKVLMLFPWEWYLHIPAGFEVEVISGRREKFEPGKTDDDKRFGCLAYGVRVLADRGERGGDGG